MIGTSHTGRGAERHLAFSVIGLAALLAVLVGPVPSIAQQQVAQETATGQLEVLDLEDYPRWSRIGNIALSPDGRWMAYSYDPLEGDNTLYVRNLDTDAVHEAARAEAPSFSADSRWVAFMVGPESEDNGGGGRGQRGGRGGDDAEDGDQATLLELASGTSFATGDAASFTFSDDGRFFAVKRRKLDADAEHEGTDLVLRDLDSGLVQNIGNVDAFAFNEAGSMLAYTVGAAGAVGNGVYVMNLVQRTLRPLDTSDQRYAQLAWNEGGTGIAALRGDTEEGKAQRDNVLLVFTEDSGARGGFARTEFDPDPATGLPEGMVLSELRGLDWSEDGERIVVGLKEQRDEDAEEDDDDEDESANVDVWHWRDERVQSVQQVRANRDRRSTDTAVVHLADGRLVRLTDEAMPSITMSEDLTFGIGRHDKPYRYEVTWGGSRADYYYVDATTGERRLLVEALGRPIGLSPDGRWYAYLKDEAVFVMDVDSGEVTDMTALSGVDFVDRQDDHPYERPVYGLMGWGDDGDWLFLEHRYDLWALPLPGSGNDPVNLTQGLGDEDAIRFRHVDLESSGGGGFRGFGGGGARTIDVDEPMLLSAYGDRTKKSGYYTVVFGDEPEPLIFEDASIGSLRKAEEVDRVIFTRQTFVEFPDYWVADELTSEALADAERVTDANPQQAEYAWSPGALLIDYVDERGNELQATLSLPAGYQQGRRYPMLVYFYELMSQNHHRYSMPAYDDRPHFSTYTSNGYLVLRPDIVYTEGRPGDSAVDDLTSAVRKVIDLGYADPDHIGLQGHSWGGYQSSFVLTQTDIFAAVVTGAPVTNLTSFYGELYKSSGNPQQGIMERGQVRMGVSPYEDFDLYVSQSPVHQAENISTPFLILHGTEDGAVDWHQGLEYYNAAKRLGKEVILLSYPGEGHHLSKRANQKDFQVRMKQFFDHYLKGEPAPPWMVEGVPFLEKGSGLYRKESR